jgi:hypothetical protein
MKFSAVCVGVLLTSFSYGQHVVKCLSKEAIDFQESISPGYKAHVDEQFSIAKSWSHNNISKVDAIYTIPVVVHIVYNTDNQNLSDEVILDQLAVLNEDFGRLNADTVNLRNVLHPIAGNPKIEFKLATIDPSGNPTNGIVRRQTSTATFGSIQALLGSFTDLEKVKSTANGGSDPWDQTRYLNIWVCNMSISVFGQETTALLGYATPPDDLPNWPAGSNPGLSDGVVIQYQCFGRNNPNPLDMQGEIIEVLGRTVTHEVGHYLGLRHIWGDGDCTQQDGIDDTPNANAQSDFDCNPSKNTCVDDIGSLGDLPDMIENYMDYSSESCQNSFTKGQVELIHGVLENQRYDLVHNNPAVIKNTHVSDFQLFPNPTTSLIHVKFSKNGVNLIVRDLKGTELLKTDSIENMQTIDLSSFDSGIYFISSENSLHSIRVIKL